MKLSMAQVVAQELRLDGERGGFLTEEAAAAEVLAHYTDIEYIEGDQQERWSKRTMWALTGLALYHFEATYTWVKMEYKFQSANVNVKEYPLRYLVRVDRSFELRQNWEGILTQWDVSATLHFTADSQIGVITPPPPGSRDTQKMYDTFTAALVNLKST